MAVPSIFQNPNPPASAFAPTQEQLYGGVQDATLKDAAMTALTLYPATRLGMGAFANAPRLAPSLEKLLKTAGYSRRYEPLKRGAGGRFQPRDPKDYIGINPNRAAVTSGLAALGLGALGGDDSSSAPSAPSQEEKKELTPVEVAEQEAKIDEGGGQTPSSWFDALNDRIDLMAMGAAMLAGSSSGEGTLANLGKGLQAGIAAKKGEALREEEKKYKDAALMLDAMRAKAAMQAASAQNNVYKNYNAKIDDLGADLVGLGVPQDEAKAVASTIFSSTGGSIMQMDPNARNTFLQQIIEGSTPWYDVRNPDVNLKKIRPAIVNISQGL